MSDKTFMDRVRAYESYLVSSFIAERVVISSSVTLNGGDALITVITRRGINHFGANTSAKGFGLVSTPESEVITTVFRVRELKEDGR